MLLFGSQQRLAQKSKDELIRTECQNAYSAASSLSPFIVSAALEGQTAVVTQEDMRKIFARSELTDWQNKMDAYLQQCVNDGLLGLQYILVAVKPMPPLMNDWLVTDSSDESMVYKWAVPDWLSEAITYGAQYVYKEDGIQELGIEKDGLVLIMPYANTPIGSNALYEIGVKSIEDRVVEMETFLDKEKGNILQIFALAMLGCLLLVIIITYFILGYLIRTRITKPIDALAANAEDVMTGKLDVEIEVREKGDFESLEKAFKAMVESIQMIINRSIKGK